MSAPNDSYFIGNSRRSNGPFVICEKHEICRADCKSACNTGKPRMPAPMKPASANTVSLESIQDLQKEIDRINRLNIDVTAVSYQGVTVELSAECKASMRFTGLSTFALLQMLLAEQEEKKRSL